MPGMHALGYRWSIATDDIPPISAGLAAFHIFWAIGMAIAWAHLNAPENCDASAPYVLSVCLLLVVFVAISCVQLALTLVCMRGAIFDTDARRLAVPILFLAFLLFLAEVAALLYGTVLVVRGNRSPCVQPWQPGGVLNVAIWTSWGVLGLNLFFVGLSIQFFANYRSEKNWERRCKNEHINADAVHESAHGILACYWMWCKCLCVLCCCNIQAFKPGPDGSAPPVERIAQLFSAMFKHVDLTVTDAITGLLLVHHKQRAARRQVVIALTEQHDQQDQHEAEHWQRRDSGRASGQAKRGLRRLLPGRWGARGTSGGKEPAKANGNGRRHGRAHALRGAHDGNDAQEMDSCGSADGMLGPCADGLRGGTADGVPGPCADGMVAGVADARDPEAPPPNSGAPGVSHPGSNQLLTPSGMLAEMRPDMPASLAAKRQGQSWEEVTLAVMEEAEHFCTYAFAAYGYMLYVWSKPQTAWCCLCFGRNCGCLAGPIKHYRELFNSPLRALNVNHHMNREAIQQVAHLDDADLAFVRHQSEAAYKQCLPYFIALDHATQSVVLSIRGTLSLDDCVTDVLYEPASLDDWLEEIPRDAAERGFGAVPPPPARLAASVDDNPRCSAHNGIMEAAHAIIRDLQSTAVLQSLMEGRCLTPGGYQPPHDCSEWQVVVTGHSLGAGCAVLTAFYLKQFYRVKCWAFSPPGGLADDRTAKDAEAFTTSVVVGKDWIARLSIGTFLRLRDDIVTAAATCEKNKWRFLLGSAFGRRWPEGALFLDPEKLKPSAKLALEQYRRNTQEARSTELAAFKLARNFVAPGRIIFLRPVKRTTKTRGRHRRYLPVWVTGRDLYEEGILVSPRMMSDHFPDYVYQTLGRTLRYMRREAELDGQPPSQDINRMPATHDPASGGGPQLGTGDDSGSVDIRVDA